MGLALDQKIKVNIWTHSIRYYISLGYDVKLKDVIYVPPEHLMMWNEALVKVICDNSECKKEKEITYCSYWRNTKNHTTDYACSNQCAHDVGKNKKTWDKKSDEEKQEIVKKLKQTKLERHGNENYVNIEKQKKTSLERHGVQGYNNREKCRQTKLENHGDEFWSNPEKISETKLNKDDKENEEINKKREETCMSTYGVSNVSQDSEILEKIRKNCFQLKDYILPSGRIVKIQGYENFALDLLFKQGYVEKDLLIEDKDIENQIGKIWYSNKKHRYLPDIYIISENKIIEVKSEWTFMLDRDKILLKKQGCINMGMKFEFMVFNKKYILLTESEVKNLI